MATMTENIIENEEEVKAVEGQGNPSATESDQERNWKAFLEKRKEEQRLFEQEKEKNRQLEADRQRREKEIADMKDAFSALLDKRDRNDSSDNDEDLERQRKFLREEIGKIFQDERDRSKKQEEQERIYKESIAIKEQMPDLVEVCNQENIAYLEFHYPEIAIPLAKMQDGFEKTKMAYQAIKKHVKMAKKDKERIEQNLSKPKSVHDNYSNENQKEESSGYLSEKRRQETYAKMQRLISGEDEE